MQRVIGHLRASLINAPHRGASLSPAGPDQVGRLQYLAVLWVVGSAALALVTLVCVTLGLNFATTVSAFLIVVVLLSLMDSFVTSAIFSVIAVGCLNFFFVEPRYTFDVANPRDLTALAAFVFTSLAVTGLVRRVRRLAEAHQEQARLLDLTTDSVVVRDMDGVITYWNRGAEELYGWKREEAVGKVSHELLQTVYPVPTEQITSTGRWEGELVRTTRDGRQVSVASRWSLQQNERGQPVGMLESDTDITERKRAEDALRRSQAAYLAEAQRLSHTGSFGWNVTSGEIFWSEESFRIFEYDPATKPTVEMVLGRVHPDDVALVRRAIDRAATHKEEFDFEHRLLMPDGSVKHLHVVAHALTHEPGDLHFVGAVMDITARKKVEEALRNSEQRYRHLFRYMPIALFQLDARGLAELFRSLRDEGVTDLGAYLDAHPDFLRRTMDALIVDEVNERSVQMFGGRDASEFAGSVARYWRESPDTFRRAMETRFRGKPFFEEETKVVTLDGRVVDVLFTAARVGPTSDLGISLVGFIDITERVRAQEMLQQLQADFAHAARVSMLGELTASIAHELNQPLAAIATSGEAGLRWLGRPAPDLAEVGASLSRMHADARRAAEIIARIRSMAARRAPERTLVSLDEVIRESLQFLRHEVQSRAVMVSHHVAPAAPKVLVDRTQLQQVIVNLAVNAMQAVAQSETGDRRIIIRTTVPDPATLRCTIEDNGPGIEAEHLSRLFESFFTTKEGGMGMGLSICRSIIEAHGGRLTADNAADPGGARLSFTLPVSNTPA